MEGVLMPPDDTTTVANLVDEAIEAVPGASPAQIAEIVVDVLDPDQYRDALRRSLAPFARDRLAIHRAHALSPAPTGSTAKRVALQGYAMSLAERARAARGVQLHVGGGRYKSLDECTDQDLLYAALYRKRVALQLQDRALRYEQLRLAMQEAGAITVAQLDDVVLMETLGGDMISCASDPLGANAHASPDVPTPQGPDI